MSTAVDGSERGRLPGLVAWGLYILSIPSLAVLAPVGALVAWFNRDADPVVRTHVRSQLRLFAIAVVWGVALFLLSIPATLLTLVLIGFPLLWLIWLAGFLVMVWFTVKSVLGLLRLLDGRPA